VRIRLDRTMCDGFGACARHAPGFFSLDDWGYASLIGNGTVPEVDHDAVKRALLDCPVHAIIEMGEYRPPGEPPPTNNSEEASEPDLNAEDSEAISEFVR
jgi:ferredoxin